MKPTLTLLASVMTAFHLMSAVPCAHGAAPAGITDHGAMIEISESRGSMITRGPKGEPLLVALLRDVSPEKGSRVSAMVFDLRKGEEEQYFFPDRETMNGDSYTLFVSSKHRLYLSVNERLFEFDLATREILQTIEGLPGPAMSMDEAADGTIYLAHYPTCELFHYDPTDGTMKQVLRLDPEEKYPTSMGIDASGWIYVGLGTVRSNIVAYHPETKTLRSLAAPKERVQGVGKVVRKLDGEVYGIKGMDGKWLRLSEGTTGAPASFSDVEPSQCRASLYWLRQRWELPGGPKVDSFSLDERRLSWTDTDGKRRETTFDYFSQGAALAAFTAANGAIYGNSSHPMYLWKFDPRADKKQIIGHLPKIGGGNFPNLTTWKTLIVGNSYSKGDFYIYQPGKPFSIAGDGTANPLLAASSSPEVRRPRGLLAHPDGRHIISTGYPSYGRVGGGMLIYDMIERKRVALIEHQNLIPDQSVVNLMALPGGNLLLGSSIRTPGGAQPKAKRAVIAELDWKTRKVLWSDAPVPEADHIGCLALLPNGEVIGVTAEGTAFVYDPAGRKVLHTQTLFSAPAGSRADTGLVSLPDGNLLLVTRNAISRVSPDGRSFTPLVQTPVPVSNVGGVLDGRLYFSSGSRLWSYRLPAPAVK